MADAKRFEVEDVLIRPGTYFNPQTEILLVVDDSPEMDGEIFDGEEAKSTEWVLISDETPLDEAVRDELLERFQAAQTGAASSAIAPDEEDEEEDLEDELTPDDEGLEE